MSINKSSLTHFLQLLTSERYELANSCGLEDWMWGPGEITWTTSEDGNPVKTNALYSYFQKLTKQSNAFLAGASKLLESGEEGADVETAVQSISLCGEIIATRDDLERAMKVLSHRPVDIITERAISTTNTRDRKGKGLDPAISIERIYAQECERLAFQHVSFTETSGSVSSYAYHSKVQQTAHATRNPKDRLHLIRELAVMATSLPPGVWVRVDEVRNDAMWVTYPAAWNDVVC